MHKSILIRIFAPPKEFQLSFNKPYFNMENTNKTHDDVEIKITSDANNQFSEVTTFHKGAKKTSFLALIFNKEKVLEHQKSLQPVTTS